MFFGSYLVHVSLVFKYRALVDLFGPVIHMIIKSGNALHLAKGWTIRVQCRILAQAADDWYT